MMSMCRPPPLAPKRLPLQDCTAVRLVPAVVFLMHNLHRESPGCLNRHARSVIRCMPFQQCCMVRILGPAAEAPLSCLGMHRPMWDHHHAMWDSPCGTHHQR